MRLSKVWTPMKTEPPSIGQVNTVGGVSASHDSLLVPWLFGAAKYLLTGKSGRTGCCGGLPRGAVAWLLPVEVGHPLHFQFFGFHLVHPGTLRKFVTQQHMEKTKKIWKPPALFGSVGRLPWTRVSDLAGPVGEGGCGIKITGLFRS